MSDRIEYDDRVEYYQNGKRHRTDGPAVEWAGGGKAWYQNGHLHRTDGPACEWADGSKDWWQNGQRHRTDGPACEWADGNKEWFVKGKKYNTEKEFLESMKDHSGMIYNSFTKRWAWL